MSILVISFYLPTFNLYKHNHNNTFSVLYCIYNVSLRNDVVLQCIYTVQYTTVGSILTVTVTMYIVIHQFTQFLFADSTDRWIPAV
jgi:hypothetical protein